ncbi:MAG TPA: hypothetical protein VGN37_20655 [Actinocatenispora sp.]
MVQTLVIRGQTATRLVGRLTLALVAILALGSLAACTPELTATSAIMRATDGGIKIVAYFCQETAHASIELLAKDDKAVAVFRGPGAAGVVTTVGSGRESRGWKRDRGSVEMDRNSEYYVAVLRPNDVTLGSSDLFYESEAERLPKGKILFARDGKRQILTLESFAATARKNC